MLRLRDLRFDDDERCALREAAATDNEADELRFPNIVFGRFFLVGFLKKFKLIVGNFIFQQCQHTNCCSQ